MIQSFLLFLSLYIQTILKMKILVDNKIPYIHDAICLLTDDVVYLPATEFTSSNVKDADVLIVRTRIKCNKELLEGSKVKFIATATIGFDHIDTEYCKEKGIVWKNAPGCNANSVRQYIQSSFILLEKEYFGSLKGLTLGIVGVGHVGSKIAELAEEFGLNVLLNDPLRCDNEKDFDHHQLIELAELADIITFHVPLSREGKYPTYHLGNDFFFRSLKKKPIIINSSRGEVIDTSSLKKYLDCHVVSQAIIDVWENEPHIDFDLLEKVFLGTPHIAGYSADGKAKATEMSLNAISDYYKLDVNIKIEHPTPSDTQIIAKDKKEALLKIYDPRIDSHNLKSDITQFEYLRSHYGLRREPSAFTIDIQK